MEPYLHTSPFFFVSREDMPIKKCERDNEQGWQWGDEGRCYLPSEEGSEEAAKQKAVDQAIAAGADPDEFAGITPDEPTELASLIDVPILSTGTHRSHNKGEVTFTEEDLDEILQGSTEVLPIIRESLKTGEYRGNETLRPKKMPGLLNFLHDGFLSDTVKKAVENIDISFKKGVKDGKTWIYQTLNGVPNDIAKAIKEYFPYRSVELLPNFRNPDTEKVYKWVIRSTAFLNKLIPPTPPAVSGQDVDLAVEFMMDNDSLVILSSDSAHDINQQEGNMEETKEQSKVQIVELQEQIAKTQTELKEQQTKNEELQRKQEESERQLVELQAQRATQEVQEFMKGLRMNAFKGLNGVVYQASPAFCDKIEPLLLGTSTSAVVELAEGSQPTRVVLMELFTDIVEMAGKDGGICVPIGELAPGLFVAPPDEQKPKTAKELMQEYQEADKNLTPVQAWAKAQEKIGTYEQ